MTSTTKPNFFLIGAPKCGTTSLYTYLCQHPEVFMPAKKEPHHFTTDSRNHQVPSRDDYEALFRDAPSQARAIGEASVWYLYSKAAVPNILDYQPEARFIVMVRNPIEMAPSLHRQELYNGHEEELSFERAWALQEERARGASIPRRCIEPAELLYGPACKLGSQLSRLFEAVPRERVRVCVLDDLKDDPQRELDRITDFLGLRRHPLSSFPVVNVAKTRRSGLLKKATIDAAKLKQRLGVKASFGFLNRLNQWNQRPVSAPAVSAEVRQMLAQYFRGDIQRLGSLLHRDLDHWFKVGLSTHN